MSSDELEQIMGEVMEDIPDADEEMLQKFTYLVLRRVRMWEE